MLELVVRVRYGFGVWKKDIDLVNEDVDVGAAMCL